MKCSIFSHLLLTLLFVSFATAQQSKKLDSLLKVYENQAEDTLKVNTLASLYNTILYNDPEAALQYAQKEYELSTKINYGKGIAMSYYHIGVYYSNSDQIDSAKYYYNQSLYRHKELKDLKGETKVNHGLAILEYSTGDYNDALAILEKNIDIYTNHVNDSSGLAITYDLKGTINTYKGNHNIALQETLKALKIFNSIDKPIRKADALNHLATIEFYLGNYQKAIQYNKDALSIYRENNDKYYESQALNDIGNTYHYLKVHDTAIQYLNQSLTLAQEMKIPDLEATALGNLGKNYNELGDFQKAISYLSQALEIVEITNSKNKKVEAMLDLGMTYNKMDLPKRAIPFFDKAIRLAHSIKAKENLRIGHYNRSLAFAKLNVYDRALEDHILYKAVSDSIYDTTKSQQIEELRIIYDTEKKEQQIVLQEKEIDLLEQEAKIGMLQRILMGGGLLFSLIGFYGIRQKMKRNKIEKEKVDAELSFKKKELTTHALNLARKNEVLEGLKQKAQELKQSETDPKGYTQLIRTIDFDLQDDNNWENFSKYFEQVHKDFNGNVKRKYPDVTSNELRLLALLKMNLSSKEIANILNISAEGIKKARYRLRKKMNITTEESLQDLVFIL